jgi:hypothetical protein
MSDKARRKHQKEMVITIGSLVIVLICVVVVGLLLYQSFSLNQQIPEYAIAFFSSIATLIMGYTFGNNK